MYYTGVGTICRRGLAVRTNRNGGRFVRARDHHPRRLCSWNTVSVRGGGGGGGDGA